MLALVVAAAALDPATLVPAAADLAFVAARAAPAAADASALLTAAGKDAPLLRPSSLGGTWERGVAVNPFDAASIAAAGASAQGGLAFGSLGRTDFLAYALEDREKAAGRLEAWLGKQLGDVETRKVKGDTVHLARRGQQVLAAYVLRRDRALLARATAPGGDPLATLAAMTAGRSLAQEAAWRKVPQGSAPWRMFVRSAGSAGPLVAALSRSGENRLVATGRAHVKSPPLLARDAAPAPVPQAAGALGAFRLRLAGSKPLAAGLAWLVREACESCSADLAGAAATRLSRLASGPAYLVLDSVHLRALGGGKLDAGAVPLLYAVPVSDAAAASKEVAALAQKMGATPGEGTSWSIGSGGQRLFFGVSSGLLHLATDPGARDRGIAAIAAGGPASAAPLAGHLDPRAVARALASVSALDALRGGALAGVFAAKLEIGAFLRKAGPIQITAAPAGADTYTFDLGWNLVE